MAQTLIEWILDQGGNVGMVIVTLYLGSKSVKYLWEQWRDFQSTHTGEVRVIEREFRATLKARISELEKRVENLETELQECKKKFEEKTGSQ